MELSLKIELDQLFSNIINHTDTLQSTLLGTNAIERYVVYKVTKKQGARSVSLIEPLEKAIKVYSDYECISPDSTKETSLYPGFIALKSEVALKEGISEIVTTINTAKSDFKAFLDKYNKPKAIVLSQGPKVKLNPILYEAYPMKSPAQIFRCIKLFDPVVNMVHFKWVRKQRYDNLTAESATRIALYNIDKPPALDYSSSAWRSKVESVIERLTKLPADTKLKRIKPAPHTPQIALRIQETSRWQKLHGSLPVILNIESIEQLKLTSELTDLNDLNFMDQRGLDKLGWKPISTELGFYMKHKL